MELAFMKSDLVNDIKTCILCKNVYNMPRSEKEFQFWMRSSVGRATDS